MTRPGFSLLELLLSSAILALMVGSIVSFTLLADFTGRRAETVAEVERMEEVLHRITRAVETADVIAHPPLSPASARAGSSLVLSDAITRSQTVFLLRDGRIQLVEIPDGGNPSFFFLTPPRVLVTNLSFLHFGDATTKSDGVSFAFRAENRATTTSVQAGSYRRHFRATATMRPSLCDDNGDCPVSAPNCCLVGPKTVGVCSSDCNAECRVVADCPSPAPTCSAACEQKIPVCGNQDQNGDGDTNDPGEKGICLSTAAGPCPTCSFCGDGQLDEDGADNAPGLLDVDDDEDGSVDNASESQFPGSDDETCDDGCRTPPDPPTCNDDCLRRAAPLGCNADCTTLRAPAGCDKNCIAVNTPSGCSASCTAAEVPPGCDSDCAFLGSPVNCDADCAAPGDPPGCNDGPPFFDNDSCTNACRTALCGDGSVYFGEEECDDGNLVNGDGCDSACKEEVVCAVARINIAFVIDTSGSMRWDDRLKAAKAAVTKFVEYMDFPKDQAAVISFGDSATLRQALTANESDLKNAVNALQPAGGTNIEDGLRLGWAQLAAATSKVKILILLTDGAPNRKNATSDPCAFAIPPSDACEVLAEANTRKRCNAASGVATGNICANDGECGAGLCVAMKASGIKVFSVGLGVDGDTTQLLQAVATGPTYYHFAPNAEELLSVYGAISDAICPCNAGDLCDDLVNDCADGFVCDIPTGKCRLSGGGDCDDSNGNNYDGCTNACFTPVCGDGIKSIGLGEQCDDGGKCNGAGLSCTKVNQATVCGADPCIPVSGDGCTGDPNCAGNPGRCCRFEPLCGNRVREGWESCDDGGTCEGGTKDGMACKRAWTDPPNADCPNGGTCTPRSGDGCSATCSGEWSPNPSYCRIEGEPCFVDSDCNEPDTIVCGSCSGGDATTYRGTCIDGVKACARSAPIAGHCPVPLCCNNVKEGYEECDDGMRCDGASGGKAGNVCAKNTDCAPGACRGFNLDGCTGTSDCVAPVVTCGYTVTPTCGTPIIADNTVAYYNNSLGSFIGDGVNWPSGTPAGVGGPQPAPSFPPDIATRLGGWLDTPTPNLTTAGATWSGSPMCIPKDWTPTHEVAILYPFTLAVPTQLFGNFEVDNGIYVWVDGVYKFGDESWGSATAYEFYDVNLGMLPAGTHYLQILLSDEGVDRSYYISVTSCYACRTGTEENIVQSLGCTPLGPQPPNEPYCRLNTMCVGGDLTETAPYCCRASCVGNCWSPMGPPVGGGPNNGACSGGQTCQLYPAEDTANIYDLPCYKCQP